MNWPLHDGPMARLIRERDWSTSALGSIDSWPDSLRACVDFLLQLNLPAMLCLHPSGFVISNDACTAVGGRPGPMGCALWESGLANDAFHEDVRRALRGNVSGCHQLEIELPSDRGSKQAWFSYNLSPLYDANHQLIGALAIFFDTTDWVLAERALRERESQLNAIFSQAQVGLSLISQAGKFLRVNDELCRMLGRDRATLLRSTIADVTHAEDLPNSMRAVQKLLSDGEPISIDKRYIRPDGTIVFANSIVTRLEGEGRRRPCILAVTVDLTARKQVQDALAQSEGRFRALADASPALIWQLDREGNTIYINPRHLELLGISEENMLGYKWDFLVHPDDREEALRDIQQAITQRHPTRRRVRVRFLDGRWHWMESHAAPWYGADGAYAGHVGIAVDVDDAVRAQTALTVSNERLKLAIEGSGDGIWDWDIENMEVNFSEHAREILCLSPTETGDPFTAAERFLHPDDVATLSAELQACKTGSRAALRAEFRIKARDDNWRWVQARATVVERHAQTDLPLRMTGTIADISEKRSAEHIVWEHANFDQLTGLPNRRLFRDRLDQELRRARRGGESLALLFIDLDRFKEANDLLGHTIGDELLVQAAQRIRACVRQSDTVARLGGDEFTAILTELDGNSHVETAAQNINATLSKPFYLGNEVVYLSASIGITLFPEDGNDAESLIRNADQAMYAVKAAGRNHFSYFTPSMQKQANDRLHLISDLRNALALEQLDVFYQPIIDLRSGKIVRAEALLRWMHPILGSIAPERFIPFAEEAGLISDIGDWVFRQAAASSVRFGRFTDRPFPISINHSPVQFVSRVNELNWEVHLHELGLTGESVSIEITEGMLLDASPVVTAKLEQYHAAGIKVAIDDFGTGYSSIAYLKKFAVDSLKIDQSFVRELECEDGGRTIVRSMIAMAHELGLEVTAEGIETRDQHRFLVEGQCDFGQGFLFSRAIPANEFERLLDQ